MPAAHPVIPYHMEQQNRHVETLHVNCAFLTVPSKVLCSSVKQVVIVFVKLSWFLLGSFSVLVLKTFIIDHD